MPETMSGGLQKGGKKVVWWVVLAIVLVLVIWVAGGYNNLVRLDQNVKGQWAQVETVYQRRLDLIPNVVSSVKGYLKQELDIVDKITEARKAYAGAKTSDAQAVAAGQLDSFVGRLLVIAESNPEIKSNQTVQALITELEGSENRVSVERQRYNDAVRAYNTTTHQIPTNVLARIFGFQDHELYEAAAGAEVAPEVKL